MRKNRITAIMVMLMFTLSFVVPAAYASGVNDINGHWAEAYIAEMVGEGIISGYPDGSFKPDGKITRAEFAALIVKGFSLTGSSGKVFNDTKDHWAKDFIAIANAKNIVNGYSETSFGPDDPITREQMAVMVVKAAKLIDKGGKTFADSPSISEWAEEAVAIATGNNIISGYPDNTFKPQGNTSRAEAAVVLSKSLAKPAPPVEEIEETTDYSLITEAGTYGPDTASETVDGNVTVKAKDTTLQNLIIKGDLIIAKEVGDGDVTLNNIKVLGKTYIRGGGKDSIHINGGDYNDIIIESTASGAVRIVATNAEGIQVVISENAKGEEVILNGDFKNVTINASDVKITTQADTTIGEVKVASGLKDVNIELAKDSSVKEMVLDSEANVRGQGTIKEASGSKAKDSRYSGSTQPDTITTPAPSGGGGGGSSSSSGSKTVVSAISVEGVPVVGETLTAAGLTPDGASVDYQWQAADTEDGDYVDIADADEATYTVSEANKDNWIRVKVAGKGNYRGTVYSEPLKGSLTVEDGGTAVAGFTRGTDGTIVVDLSILEENNKIKSDSSTFTALNGQVPGTGGTQGVGYTGYKITLAGTNGSGNISVKAWRNGEERTVTPDNNNYLRLYPAIADRSGGEGSYTWVARIGEKVEWKLEWYEGGEGEEELTARTYFTTNIRAQEHSEYGFEIDGDIEIVVVDNLPEGSSISTEGEAGEPGTVPDAALEALAAAFSLQKDDLSGALISVTFKAKEPFKELGYEKVRILPLEVSGPADGTLQAWMYAAVADQKWFDLVQTGWGSPGTGFRLDIDEESLMQAYVFADTPGTYTVTFKAVDTSDPENEPVIATGTATVNVISQKVAAKAAIKPSWEIGPPVEVAGEGLPAEVGEVGYKVTIKTSYENKTDAQNSGRTVTTFFTIPEGVTVWYPVWEDGSLTYKSATEGEVAYGMAGHPLNAGNIDADGIVYVTLDEDLEDTEVTFTIKLVDAVWEDVVYGENDELSFDISDLLDEAAKFAAKAAIKPIWEVVAVEAAGEDLPGGVSNVDYKVTIKTSYVDLEAAQASGRTVTTLFTIPDGVTVYYPVWEGSTLTYKSGANEEVAYGMVGHPLSAGNIEAEGIVYVDFGETEATEFTIPIKLVDAVWDDVGYGEQNLVVEVPGD